MTEIDNGGGIDGGETKNEANVCAKCNAVIEDYDGVSFCYGELPSTTETVQRCPAVFCSSCSSLSFVCPHFIRRMFDSYLFSSFFFLI